MEDRINNDSGLHVSMRCVVPRLEIPWLAVNCRNQIALKFRLLSIRLTLDAFETNRKMSAMAILQQLRSTKRDRLSIDEWQARVVLR